MSYHTWHTYGYGICVSDIREENISRMEALLTKAPQFSKEFHQWLSDCTEGDPPEWEDYMEYEDDCCNKGLAAILKEVILEAETVNFTVCDDFDGFDYLVYEPAYPWSHLSNAEKGLTEEKLDEILRKYVNILTDQPIDISYQAVGNGG